MQPRARTPRTSAGRAGGCRRCLGVLAAASASAAAMARCRSPGRSVRGRQASRSGRGRSRPAACATDEARLGDVHVQLLRVARFVTPLHGDVDRRLGIGRIEVQELLLHGPRRAPSPRSGSARSPGRSSSSPRWSLKAIGPGLEPAGVEGRRRRHVEDRGTRPPRGAAGRGREQREAGDRRPHGAGSQ